MCLDEISSVACNSGETQTRKKLYFSVAMDSMAKSPQACGNRRETLKLFNAVIVIIIITTIINFTYPRIYTVALLLISPTYLLLEIRINESYIQIYLAILSVMFKTIIHLEQM